MKNAIKVLIFTLVFILAVGGSVLVYLNLGKSDYEIVAGAKTDTVEIVKYNGNKKNVDIPEKINGKTVVSIGANAFSKTDIESVEIPKTVGAIGENAFLTCEKLKSVILNEGIVEIGDGAFVNCTALESLNLPSSVKKLGGAAFQQCEKLDLKLAQNSNFVFDDEILYDKEKTTVYWLKQSKDISNYTFPKTVTEFTTYLFSNHTELKSFTVPAGVEKIPELLFVGCTNLENVVVCEGVKSIDDMAFFGCTGLKSVTVAKSVGEIGKGNFPAKDREEMKDFKLKLYKNSSAFYFAEENNINFEFIEG